MSASRFRNPEPTILRRYRDMRNARWADRLSFGLYGICGFALSYVLLPFVGVNLTVLMYLTIGGLVLIGGYFLLLAALLPAGSSRRGGFIAVAATYFSILAVSLACNYLLPMVI